MISVKLSSAAAAPTMRISRRTVATPPAAARAQVQVRAAANTHAAVSTSTIPAELTEALASQATPSSLRDDSAWLQEKLNQHLGGLETGTRRARVRALRVLHVNKACMSYHPTTHQRRCTGLDLDIAWEAEPVGPAKEAGVPTLHGMARVKLSTQGGDKVQILDVQVLEEGDMSDGAPCMPCSCATSPDVLLTVESLDGAIMDHLNSFMWELEQAQTGAFPLTSFELEEVEEEEQEENREPVLPGFTPAP